MYFIFLLKNCSEWSSANFFNECLSFKELFCLWPYGRSFWTIPFLIFTATSARKLTPKTSLIDFLLKLHLQELPVRSMQITVNDARHTIPKIRKRASARAIQTSPIKLIRLPINVALLFSIEMQALQLNNNMTQFPILRLSNRLTGSVAHSHRLWFFFHVDLHCKIKIRPWLY